MKFAFAVLLACIAVTAAIAQQTVPFRNNIPVAPSGIPAVPLPDKPVVYDTAEGQRIRLVVVTRGLSHPWSLAFLPDPSTPLGASGNMLVTERTGQLRLIRNGVLDPQPIAGVPAVRSQGLSGLMDVALHPQFAQNRLVYLTYTKPLQGTQNTLALARGRLDGQTLTDVRDVFVASAGTGRRIENRVRPRRHDLHDNRRGRRQGRAGPEQPRRQGAATARRWQCAD
jgi:glucose/arabinose dehydrogenase